ncbi:hypothetical protein TNCV_143251 [Trichonephila clavipes]|nr:hypothetical protein TNCV_143251 [Trichonephila clavipes]
MGLNPREGMDVCKCILLLRHGATLSSRWAVSPLVRFVEGEKGGGLLITPSVSYLKIGVLTGTNCTVTCMVFKATTSARGTSYPLPQ